MQRVLALLTLPAAVGAVAACEPSRSDWAEHYVGSCEYVDLDGVTHVIDLDLPIGGPVEGAAVGGEGAFEVYNTEDCVVTRGGAESSACFTEMVYCVDTGGCTNGEEPFEPGQYRLGVPLDHVDPWSPPRVSLDGSNTLGEPVIAASGVCTFTEGSFVYAGGFELVEAE